jgi:hypothetical protein
MIAFRGFVESVNKDVEDLVLDHVLHVVQDESNVVRFSFLAQGMKWQSLFLPGQWNPFFLNGFQQQLIQRSFASEVEN